VNVVAIIPARGGSKRVPRKNIRPLAGKPLIAHTIDHALASALIQRVIVSTDDADIASISRSHGAEIIERPAELSHDFATSESALCHVLSVLRERDAWLADLIVFLQCTSPVREQGDVDRAIKTLQAKGADSLLSGCRSHAFLWTRQGERLVSINYDFRNRQRSQDFPKQFAENGSIYIFKPWVLTEFNNRLGGEIALYEMDYWSSFQIDSEEEFELCEWILNCRQRPRAEGLDNLSRS
jgi:N-acylneuraminate cytidylyltransferase